MLGMLYHGEKNWGTKEQKEERPYPINNQSNKACGRSSRRNGRWGMGKAGTTPIAGPVLLATGVPARFLIWRCRCRPQPQKMASLLVAKLGLRRFVGRHECDGCEQRRVHPTDVVVPLTAAGTGGELQPLLPRKDANVGG